MAKKIKALSVDGFAEKHPFAATFVLCSLALLFGQKYHTSFYDIAENTGVFRFIWQLPMALLLVLAVYAAYGFAAERGRGMAKRVAFAATVGLGTAFVECVLFKIGEDFRKLLLLALAAALFALFAYLLVVKKRLAGIAALAACLALSASIGAGVALFVLCLGLYAACVYSDDGLEKTEKLCCAAMLLCAFAAAYLCNTVVHDPLTRIVLLGFIASFALFLIRSFRKGSGIPPLIVLMFCLGLVVRFAYVQVITVPQNQHDVFSYFSDLAKYPRHNSYILYIYNNHSLPKEDILKPLSQYYHPPLYHILAALWMRFQTFCGLSAPEAFENIQYLTVAFSSCLTVAGYKLLEEFRLKGAVLYAAFAILAFHPTFYILGGSINNDVLSILFTFLAMLYTVRWYRDKSYKNTLLLALFISLGMATKLSVAVIAFGTGFVFLHALFNKRTGGFAANIKALWKKLALFAAVAFPIGLWWPIRCLVKYGMPLGYVPSMTVNNPQYVGGYSFVERLTGIGFPKLADIYPNIGPDFYDYGIAPYAVKTSLFGEYFTASALSTQQKLFGYVLFISAAVLIAASLAGLVLGVVSLFRKEKPGILCSGNRLPFAFLAVFYFFLVGSYVIFCFTHPFTCTMDFRYIVPSLPIGAVCAGLLVNGQQKWACPLRAALSVTAAVFALSSVGFYMLSF